MITGVRAERAAAKGVTPQQEPRTVAPVKEGGNDAPALAKADVGRRSGRAPCDRKVQHNPWWAAGYDLVAGALNARLRPRLDLSPESTCTAVDRAISKKAVRL